MSWPSHLPPQFPSLEPYFYFGPSSGGPHGPFSISSSSFFLARRPFPFRQETNASVAQTFGTCLRPDLFFLFSTRLAFFCHLYLFCRCPTPPPGRGSRHISFTVFYFAPFGLQRANSFPAFFSLSSLFCDLLILFSIFPDPPQRC